MLTTAREIRIERIEDCGLGIFSGYKNTAMLSTTELYSYVQRRYEFLKNKERREEIEELEFKRLSRFALLYCQFVK